MITLGVVLALAVAVAVIVVWRGGQNGPITAASLHASVERESGSAADALSNDDEGSCRRVSTRRWRCSVIDSGYSGSALYEVTVKDESCWQGELVEPVGEPMPDKIRGCTLIRD